MEHLFLNQLVLGMYHDKKEIEEKKKFYKTDMLDGKLAVIILEMDNIQNIIKEKSEEELQLLKLFIIRTADKIAREKLPSRFFIGTDGSIIGICRIHSGLQNLLTTLKEIQRVAWHSKGINISAGISNQFEDIQQMNTHLNQARQAIRQKLCLGYQSIVLYSDIENITEAAVPTIHLEVNHLIDLIFKNEKENITNYIYRSFSILKNKIYKSLEFVDSYILKLLFELNGYFIQYDFSIRNFLLEHDCSFQEIYLMDTLDQKTAWLSNVLIQISQKVNDSRNDKVTRIIAEIIRYLDKNYWNNSVGLDSIAEQFKKSPPYLSKLFKEETGENFTDYLTRLRMEKAKELLRDVTIKVYEVPSLVGYADVSHFSRKFKAYTGLSPSQFQNEYV